MYQFAWEVKWNRQAFFSKRRQLHISYRKKNKKRETSLSLLKLSLFVSAESYLPRLIYSFCILYTLSISYRRPYLRDNIWKLQRWFVKRVALYLCIWFWPSRAYVLTITIYFILFGQNNHPAGVKFHPPPVWHIVLLPPTLPYKIIIIKKIVIQTRITKNYLLT